MEKDLKIKISVDKKTGAINVVNGEFKDLDKSVGKTDKSTKKFQDRLANMAHAGAAIYGLKQAFDVARAALGELIGTAAKFETQQSILKTLEGDSVAAQKSFEWIAEFTSQTPYQMEKVGEAFLKAKAYGIDPTTGSLETLGDTAAGMGKSLEQAVEAMADAMTGENERLKEFGVKAKVLGDEVAYNWTTSSGQAKHIVVANNSEVIQSTLNALFNSKYKGAMQDQMDTWNGITSNVTDTYTLMLNDIANKSGIFDGLKHTLKDLGTEFKGITDNKEDMEALYSVARSGLIMTAKGFEGLSNVVIGGMYVFETISMIIEQIANNAKYAFYGVQEAWYEMIYEINASANGVLPDFMKDKLGISDESVKQSRIELNKVRQTMADIEVDAAKRKVEHYEYVDGLNIVKETISSTVDNLEKYTLSLDTNTEAKNKNKKADFGEDGSYDAGNDKQNKDFSTALNSWETYYETVGEYETAWLIKQGVLAQEYQDLTKEQFEKVAAIAKTKYFDELDTSRAKALKAHNVEVEGTQLAYYKAIGDVSNAFYIEEGLKLQKLAETGMLTNEEMLQVWEADLNKFNAKTFKDQNKFWFDLFDDIEKSMDNQIFDAMTDKWTSFGDWLKDFWSSITTSIARGVSSQLSQSLIGGVKDMLGFGATPSTSGSATSTIISTLGKLTGGIFTTGGVTTAASASDAAGTALGAKDLVSAASNLKTATTLFTEGLTSVIYGPSALLGSLAGSASAAGFTGTASVLAGGANVLGGGGVSGLTGGSLAGGIATAGLAGGIGGAALGGLGDMLLGADTQATTGGAIGGATGAIIGSIFPGIGTLLGGIVGSALGAIVGGIFGKTKTTAAGLFSAESLTADSLDELVLFVDKEKKSWFSSKSWTEFTELDEATKKQISSIFSSYDFLLSQLGEFDDIVVSAGKYPNETLQDAIAQSALMAYTGAPTVETLRKQVEGETDVIAIADILYTGLFGRTSGFEVGDKNYNYFVGKLRSLNMTQVIEDLIVRGSHEAISGDVLQGIETFEVWEQYAKDVDMAVGEAITNAFQTVVGVQREFELFALQRDGLDLEALSKQAEFVSNDFNSLAEIMGQTGLTVENFLDRYNEAMRESFTPEAIEQWNTLSDTLMSATNAQDAYNDALAQSIAETETLAQQMAIDEITSLADAYTTFSQGVVEAQRGLNTLNGSFMTFAEAGDDPAKIMKAYQAQLDGETKLHNERLAFLNNELVVAEKLTDYSKTLIDTAESLMVSAMSGEDQLSFTEDKLNRLIADATMKLSVGQDIGTEVSGITALTDEFSKQALEYSGSSREAGFAIAVMANKIEALGGQSGTASTLGDIEEAIILETVAFEVKTDELKDLTETKLQEIIDAYSIGQDALLDVMNESINDYEAFWGADSEIVKAIKDIQLSALSQEGSQVSTAYQSVLGIEADTAGANYWAGELASGALSSSNLGIAVGVAGVENGDISRADYITSLYEQGLGRTPSAKEVDYWANQSNTATEDLASNFEEVAPEFTPFANGGVVDQPTVALFGEAGTEAFVPLPDGKTIPVTLNNPMKAVVAELKALRKDTAQQTELIAQQANEIKALRKENEDQSILLSEIEEKIA